MRGLLGQQQSSSSKAILIDSEDRIAGDTDRADVAAVVARLLLRGGRKKRGFTALSVVNGPGAAPSLEELDRLLYTV